MITKFKIYEFISNDIPKIGDYVICKEKYSNNIKFKDLNLFIENNIVIIIEKYKEEYNTIDYKILYNNIPENMQSIFFDMIASKDNKGTRIMSNREIIYISHNKEELKIKLNQLKYNL